ncbi:MAG: hypothetical protein AAB289_16960 [Chloroflexota bacterium]
MCQAHRHASLSAATLRPVKDRHGPAAGGTAGLHGFGRWFPEGARTIKLESAPVAQYRYRVGEYRILFDIDDAGRVLEIIDIREAR